MARGEVNATIHVEGLSAFRRDLRRLAPEAEKQLRGDLKDIASDVAGEVQSRVGARSFTYRGTATTGLRSAVRSAGPKGYVARFREFGSHPRGSTTFIPGRNDVGTVLERRESELIDRMGDRIMDAARKSGWH